ncbi:hypothetical protein ACOME3_004729 [Neoechinorhynchus agilis]
MCKRTASHRSSLSRTTKRQCRKQLLENEKRDVVHSGHFMSSVVHERRESDSEVMASSPMPDQSHKEPILQNVQRFSNEQCVAPLNPEKKTSLPMFEMDLSRISNSLSAIFRQLNTPKWKSFRGFRIPFTLKIRLNNLIWRGWHRLYIQRGARWIPYSKSSDAPSVYDENIIREGEIERFKEKYKKWRSFSKVILTEIMKTGDKEIMNTCPEDDLIAQLDFRFLLHSKGESKEDYPRNSDLFQPNMSYQDYQNDYFNFTGLPVFDYANNDSSMYIGSMNEDAWSLPITMIAAGSRQMTDIDANIISTNVTIDDSLNQQIIPNQYYGYSDAEQVMPPLSEPPLLMDICPPQEQCHQQRLPRASQSHSKDSLKVLKDMVPGLVSNIRISKAGVLKKTSEYVVQLRNEVEGLKHEIMRCKTISNNLEKRISDCQKQLPLTGLVTHLSNCQPDNQYALQLFHDYVREETTKSWKFYLMAQILKPVYETYCSTVHVCNPQDLYKTTMQWLNTYLTLDYLRPAATNAIRKICMNTEIMDHPEKLPDQCRQAADEQW